jgi:hypothetical protein
MPEVKVSWAIDASQTSKSTRVLDVLDATEFRVDTSIFRTGFEDGRFESHQSEHPKGARESAQHPPTSPAMLVVTDLQPGVVYFVRVLAGTPDGWVPSEVVRFFTPICPVDSVEEGR